MWILFLIDENTFFAFHNPKACSGRLRSVDWLEEYPISLPWETFGLQYALVHYAFDLYDKFCSREYSSVYFTINPATSISSQAESLHLTCLIFWGGTQGWHKKKKLYHYRGPLQILPLCRACSFNAMSLLVLHVLSLERKRVKETLIQNYIYLHILCDMIMQLTLIPL